MSTIVAMCARLNLVQLALLQILSTVLVFSWNDWCRHRLANYGDAIPPLDEITITDLADYLSSFVYEVRKQDGSEFPPESLHHIVSALQRFLRWNGKPGIDIYKDTEFADFRSCLDSEMKQLVQRAGLG